jgi:predicted HicB family RNase H-like nuclease
MIKNFQHFYDDNLLHESLNTPVEFYMTDDTQLPNRIYAAFKMDDDTYGMSLEASDHKGIYLLKMYRVLAKKPRKWSFKKPSHIRPALSTLLKFIEASVPFIKPQLKGIICQVAGQNADKYIRFAERILKKTYITSFKVLPTTKSPDKKIYPWENIFVSRVGISPKAVFSDPKFSSYDFPDGILTHEVAEVIKPKMKEKQTVKTEPSKKYKFGNIEVDEITIDSEVFDMITKIEKVVNLDNQGNLVSGNETDVDASGLTEKNKKFLNRSFSSPAQKKKISNLYSIANKDSPLILATLVKKYKEEHPNEVIREIGDVQFVLDQIFKDSTYKHLRNYLKEIGDISSEDGMTINSAILSDVLDRFEKGLPKKTVVNTTMNIITQFEKTLPKAKVSGFKYTNKGSKNTSLENVYKTNILPEQLISNMPGVGKFKYLDDFTKMKQGANVDDESVKLLLTHLENELGYYDAISNLKYYDSIRDYTGGSYDIINSNLRTSFELLLNKNPNKNDLGILRNKLKTGYIPNIVSAFDELKPLPESLWVYRNTDLPEKIIDTIKVGEDFVDPAFLSTTIRSTMDFSGSKGNRFRIFLPKGSKTIPVLNHSKHNSENEIILPPFSILKIIRVDEYNNEYFGSKFKSYVFTSIYVGSVFKNFKEQFEDKVKKFLEESNDLKTKPKKSMLKYDPSKKFGNGTDAELLKAAAAFAKSMKMKDK